MPIRARRTRETSRQQQRPEQRRTAGTESVDVALNPQMPVLDQAGSWRWPCGCRHRPAGRRDARRSPRCCGERIPISSARNSTALTAMRPATTATIRLHHETTHQARSARWSSIAQLVAGNRAAANSTGNLAGQSIQGRGHLCQSRNPEQTARLPRKTSIAANDDTATAAPKHAPRDDGRADLTGYRLGGFLNAAVTLRAQFLDALGGVGFGQRRILVELDPWPRS